MSRFKLLSVFIALIICVTSVSAQTRYYKQIKVVDTNRKQSPGDGSGQFITFNKDVCYDSDRNGYTVNNGFAKFGKDNGERVYYSGTSYWGNATYIFTENYNRLNIVLSGGTTYVYVLSAAPANAKTSSLIKKHEPVPAPSPVVVIPGPDPLPPSPRPDKLQLKRRQCSFCNGSCVNPGKDYIPNYTGQEQTRYCAHCGGYSAPHTHGKCPSCNGKGYIETYN
ncbi:hypothetical protein [uncultured Alistipes sp.]|uniref:hypothetical protein n=1 Tax=uncultured Alistipes sp. TaxID=538949 RepID=UPI0025F2A9B7|nr:hypothetical protein [uncultured Alistipes sp.]